MMFAMSRSGTNLPSAPHSRRLSPFERGELIGREERFCLPPHRIVTIRLREAHPKLETRGGQDPGEGLHGWRPPTRFVRGDRSLARRRARGQLGLRQPSTAPCQTDQVP